MKTGNLAKNTVLLLVNKFSAQLVSILLLPIYTAFFTAEDYGAATLALTYINLLIPIATIRLDMGIFRYMIDARGDKRQITEFISSAFTLILPLMAIMLTVGMLVGIIFDIPLFVYVVIGIITTMISSILSQMTRGLGHTRSFVTASVAGTVCSFVVTLLGIFLFGVGFEIILIAPIIANTVMILILAYQTKIHRFIHPSIATRAARKQLVSYSLPLIPDSMSFWVMDTSDRTILSVVLGVASTGIYAVSNKATAILNGIIGVFYMSWSEEAALVNKKPNRNKIYSGVLDRYLRIIWSLCLLLISVMPLGFAILVQGEEFQTAYLYIPVLIVAMGVHAFAYFLAAIYQAQKLTKQLAVTTMASAVINIVVNVVLIFWIGVWAAAISTLIAYLALSIYRFFDIKRRGVKITLNKKLLLGVAAVIVAVTSFYYMNSTLAHVVGIVVASVASVFINRSTVLAVLSTIKKKFKGRSAVRR